MAVDWTPHRFSGGVLALDMANTVVMRGDPRGFDRFADPGEIPRFAEAAAMHRADEFGGRRLEASPENTTAAVVIELREAIDALFRAKAARQRPPDGALPRLLRACAAALDGEDEDWDDEAAQEDAASRKPAALPAAAARSALSLLCKDASGRIRICANCNWLFLDRSRNGSRVWCDMAVCGNRQKAKRHYRRRKTEEVRHA